MNIDVLCVGHASFDMIFSVSAHPGADEKTVADAFLGCGGGPAANAAVTVARLGLKSAFAGYLGRDAFGDIHMKELEAEGVYTGLIVRGDYPSPVSTVIVKPDGRRALVSFRGDTQWLKEDSIDFKKVKPRVILFDGHEPLVSVKIAEHAKRNHITTVLDAGSVHKGTLELCSMVDYLVCSRKFALTFTQMNNETDALKKLIQTNPNVIITLGKDGLIWSISGGSGKMDAFRVKAIDTTGAGDSFHGAFAACLASGKSLDETLRYSSAASALCCTKTGARPGIPNKDKVESFLKNRERE